MPRVFRAMMSSEYNTNRLLPLMTLLLLAAYATLIRCYACRFAADARHMLLDAFAAAAADGSHYMPLAALRCCRCYMLLMITAMPRRHDSRHATLLSLS